MNNDDERERDEVLYEKYKIENYLNRFTYKYICTRLIQCLNYVPNRPNSQ